MQGKDDRHCQAKSDRFLLNLKPMTFHKGYACCQNRITKRFYAIPIGDDFMFNKIVADSAVELKQAIDLAPINQCPHPWELPYAGEGSITLSEPSAV